MINRIVFAAGGTGGHIFPAIAVADELRKLNKNIDIYFMGAKGKIEESIVPECGYKLKTIDITGFQRAVSLKNIALVFKLLAALKESKSFLIKFNPDVVFGTGGYVSGPVLR
ncbi:MAG: UDP-N-acetylglucosamine--N-acetylmuramyl-(pentapeptide) pyrophosphoryl-undecaprenol N-acetylglucosamine transferase, partial [Ignavibacteria bacterium]